MGGLCYCIDSGISVPESIVLAGFNGLDILDAFPGKIATSKTSRQEIGVIAAKIILDSFKNDASSKIKNQIIQPTISLGQLKKN
jgi:LacI family gluconate utilization system Gnt-I transcriptional repressor